jgi:hypothetical protein
MRIGGHGQKDGFRNWRTRSGILRVLSNASRNGSGKTKANCDPMKVLAVCKPLYVKEGFVLRAYQFREGGNGNGFVWAMPVEAEFPEPQECPRLQGVFLEPPKPPAALGDFMDAVDGLLARED